MFLIFNRSKNYSSSILHVFLLIGLLVNVSLFGQHVSSIAAIQNNDGSLEIFVARSGNEGGIYHTWQETIDSNWPNPWHVYDTQGKSPDNNEHGLAAGKDSRGRIIFCYISNGIIYSWVSQRMRSSLVTSEKYTFRYPTTELNHGGLDNVQSHYNYVTIANNADRSIEIIALDEAGRVWSIKQIKNDAEGKWQFARPKYIGSPIEYNGPKLKSISAAKYADGRLALVALAEDGSVYWSSQLVAKSPSLYHVQPNFQAGQWSGQWQSLGGHDLKEVVAEESRDHQLEVIALGGDNNIYTISVFR